MSPYSSERQGELVFFEGAQVSMLLLWARSPFFELQMECRWRVIARFSAKLHGFDSGLGGPGEKQNEHSCVENGMICRSRAKFVFGILFFLEKHKKHKQNCHLPH